MKFSTLLYLSIYIYITLTSFSCDEEIDINAINSFSCELEKELKEISGLIPFGNNLLAHGDSGSDASLYELDSSCIIINEFKILEVENEDWEALTQDDTFIYIGDFGNNAGERKDLNILKIDKSKLGEETPFELKINFKYEDQVEFGNDDLHNFDCEAMLVEGNRIILFTKNRGNHLTHLYELNTFEENQIAKRLTEINISDLVTGAFYNREEGIVFLTSYSRFFNDGFTPFLYYFNFDLSSENIVGNIEKRALPVDSQIESICIIENNILFAREAEIFGNAVLYQRLLSQYVF